MEEKPLKVLVIEPDPAYIRQINKLLSEAKKEYKQMFELEYAGGLSLSLDRLAKGGIDIILLDLSLPENPGLEALSQLYARAKDTAIIVLLDNDKSGLARGALYNGAMDCLLKDELDSKLLVHSISFSLKQHQLYLQLIRAKEKIEIKEAQFHELIEKYLDTIIVLDMQKIVRFVNPTAELLYGCSQEELLGKEFSFPIVLDKIVEMEITCKSGKTATVQMRAITIEWEGENAYFVMLQDITERKRVEEELKKIDQLRSDFVSTVSHELRTPLTMIREAVSQVIDGICGEINKEQQQFLFMSIEEIDRLSRLIENLLSISKIEAHKIEFKRDLIDIVSLAKEVSSSFASAFQSKGLEIKYNFPKNKIELYVDKDRITQIFMNLMSNALKFTPAGYIEISIVDKENVVECAVFDTGIGISDEDLTSVFSKFKQFCREFESTEKGTGLGLAISKGIIELHRGKIWLESKLDQGTKISFTLPKYSPRELFKEYVTNGLAEAIKEGASLSIIIFEVKNYNTLQEKLGQDKIASIMHSLGQLIKTGLRRKSDISIKNSRAILVALPEADKKGAWSTAERLKSSFDDYLSKEELTKEIEFDLIVASFPEDANTEEELLNKVQLRI